MQLVRIQDDLPEDFGRLRAAADAEGFRALARLAAEWAQDRDAFVCLLGAMQDDRLAAIGGLTPEPEPQDQAAMRVRRLYVDPAARRSGVGRTLVNALLQEALDSVSLVTINARDTLAPAFWTAVGFERVTDLPWSHQFVAH
ncbi:GNAT family N-acetyltransferase [Phenylobacterium sp.]|uniref:GNAT family N-acetyltransferase n=1 Tax=Phenylobacterium sp. TaxID=1871053 RepID=UPI0025DA4ACC|nr:GNAT family N-acetyltransferase [Phenylobacterium sp.]